MTMLLTTTCTALALCAMPETAVFDAGRAAVPAGGLRPPPPKVPEPPDLPAPKPPAPPKPNPKPKPKPKPKPRAS